MHEENTDDDTDWSEDSGDSIESLAISLIRDIFAILAVSYF